MIWLTVTVKLKALAKHTPLLYSQHGNHQGGSSKIVHVIEQNNHVMYSTCHLWVFPLSMFNGNKPLTPSLLTRFNTQENTNNVKLVQRSGTYSATSTPAASSYTVIFIPASLISYSLHSNHFYLELVVSLRENMIYRVLIRTIRWGDVDKQTLSPWFLEYSTLNAFIWWSRCRLSETLGKSSFLAIIGWWQEGLHIERNDAD